VVPHPATALHGPLLERERRVGSLNPDIATPARAGTAAAP
jgi:hypothetical protein